MRGRKKTYMVVLMENEEEELGRVIASRKSPQGEVLRAKVVLTCWEHPGWTDDQVAQAVGCSPGMVRKWRQRWVQTHSLKEAPRSGRRRVFPPRGESASYRLGLQPTKRSGGAGGSLELCGIGRRVGRSGGRGVHRRQHGVAVAQSGADQTLALS